MSEVRIRRRNAGRALVALGFGALLTTGLVSGQNASSIFSIQRTPNPSPQGNTFNALTAIAADDVWAVGFKGQNEQNNDAQTLTAHWNGSQWSVVPSPNLSKRGCSFPDNTLTGASGVASNDV